MHLLNYNRVIQYNIVYTCPVVNVKRLFIYLHTLRAYYAQGIPTLIINKTHITYACENVQKCRWVHWKYYNLYMKNIKCRTSVLVCKTRHLASRLGYGPYNSNDEAERTKKQPIGKVYLKFTSDNNSGASIEPLTSLLRKFML